MKTGLNKTIGALLRKEREERGLSQRDLGAILNVTLQQIQKYENGSNRISAESLVIILNNIGKSPAAFISELHLPQLEIYDSKYIKDFIGLPMPMRAALIAGAKVFTKKMKIKKGI